MQNSALVTIEELDAAGHVWRRTDGHMVRSNVDRSIAAIRAAYNMDRTRILVDGQVVAEARRH